MPTFEQDCMSTVRLDRFLHTDVIVRFDLTFSVYFQGQARWSNSSASSKCFMRRSYGTGIRKLQGVSEPSIMDGDREAAR
jgi:hypothetical protein